VSDPVRRYLAVLLVAVLLVLGVAWLLQDSDSEAPPPAGSTPPAESVEPGVAAGGSLPAAKEAGAISRQALEDSADPSAGSASTLRLRVVRTPGGAGVPNVSVRWLDGPTLSSAALRSRTRDSYQDWDEIYEEFGQQVLSDAAGEVRLPRMRGILWNAHLGSEYASGWVSAETTDGEEILLQPDLEVRVQVLDADGRPAAKVPVAWLGWAGDRARAILSARTGPDGIARIRHLQTQIPLRLKGRQTLALLVPGAQAGQVPFDPLQPPAEVVTLRLPATGQVVVEVLDAEGNSFPDRTHVYLQRAWTEEERSMLDDPGRLQPDAARDSVRASLEGGRAVFPHVGVGIPLECLSYFQEGQKYFGTEHAGLTVAGQEILIQVRHSLVPTRITARLLRPNGSPIADAQVGGQVRVGGTMQDATVETDGDGRCQQFLDEEQWSTELTRESFLGTSDSPRRLILFVHPDPDLSQILAAQLDLQELLGPGLHDFGDLVLGGEGTAASGRVVDEAGLPLAGVGVMVVLRNEDDQLANMDVAAPYSPSPSRTGADGRFALRFAGAPAADWSLHFRLEGYLPFELRGIGGGAEREVRMTRASFLSGRLLLDPGIPSDLLRIDWRRDVRNEHEYQIQATLDPEMRFHAGGAAAGTGILTIRSNQGIDELARIEGVALGATDAVDPRLDPLDLRGKLHAYQLRVFDAEGQRPEELILVFEGERRVLRGPVANPARLLLGQPGMRLTVFSRGSAAATVVLDDPELEVRLERGIEARLRIEGVDWPQEGLELQAVPALDGVGWLHDSEARFGRDGRAAVSLPEPGRYTLTVNLIGLRKGERYRAQVRPTDAAGNQRFTFEIRPGEPPQEIVLALTPADLEAARAAMR